MNKRFNTHYMMCFAPLKSKVILQDWLEPVPVLILSDDRLGADNSL